MLIFNPFHRVQNQIRHRHKFLNHNFLIDHAWHQILDRLADINRHFEVPLIIGNRDISSIIQTPQFNHQSLNTTTDTPTEFFDLPVNHFDCILSVFELHTLNDLPDFLVRIRQSLKPDGVFLAAFPGNNSLHELRDSLMRAELELTQGVTPRVHPTISTPQMAALMQQAKFALPVVDHETLTIEYTTFNRLLDDLRFMGEANVLNARTRNLTARRLFKQAATLYEQNYATPTGHLIATFDLIYVIGWAPADTQPKAKKPGSATIRLADALARKVE